MTSLYDADDRLPAPIDRHQESDLEMTWGYEEDGMGLPRPLAPRSSITGLRVIAGALILAVVAGFICYQVGHVSGRQTAQEAAQVTIAAYTDAAERASKSADYWRAAAIDASATADALESDLASITAEWQRQAEEASATILILQQKRAAKRSAPRVLQVSTDGWSTAKASWYGSECYGHNTANGTPYTPDAWGVAHKSLPFGTLIEISYDGKTVTAPVFDRGPFVAGRAFDLSAAVARSLGFSGVQTISWRVVGS